MSNVILFSSQQINQKNSLRYKKIMELQIITNEIKEFADDENFYIES